MQALALAAEFDITLERISSIVGIVRTNVLSTDVGSGLFPVLSCASHSCAFNCVMTYPDALACNFPRKLSFSAVRDIAPCEEITISYLLYVSCAFEEESTGPRTLVTRHISEWPTRVRQLYLHKAFNFYCRCTRCVAFFSGQALDEVEGTPFWVCSHIDFEE
jgi:hypothetical protein